MEAPVGATWQEFEREIIDSSVEHILGMVPVDMGTNAGIVMYPGRIFATMALSIILQDWKEE